MISHPRFEDAVRAFVGMLDRGYARRVRVRLRPGIICERCGQPLMWSSVRIGELGGWLWGWERDELLECECRA